MQNIVNAASNAVSSLTGQVQNLTGHSHAEEHQQAQGAARVPPDSTASEVRKVDAVGLAVFEEEAVRHAVLVKINQLAIDDVKHGLKEVAALELVKDGHKKGITYYHPLRYFTVERPFGTDYIGEIEIEQGKSIHVRVHKAGSGAATLHSIDTRPSAEGGAVFETGEPLVWFDY